MTMRTIFRGCFQQISYRKYRNLIGFTVVAIATTVLLQATFGRRNFLNFGEHRSFTKHKAFRNHRQNPFNDRDTVRRVNTILDRDVTPSCFPDNLKPDEIKTPFKFFIYNLPSKFNYEIQKRMSMDKKYAYCYDLFYCGAGKEFKQFSYQQGRPLFREPFKGRSIYSNFTMSIRDTQQFSLEVIIHYKLLHSKYRTMDPSKADIFYIPAYTGLKCLQDREGAQYFIRLLFDYLNINESKYFYSGKPHFSTLSKIQREQGSDLCNTLKQPESENITYIGIEKEANPGWQESGYIFGKSIIVAPYPSYIHFAGVKHDKTLLEYQDEPLDLKNTQFRLNVPSLLDRNVLLFFAAGSRRSNPFRAQIIDQFPFQTHGSYEEYTKEHSNVMKKTNTSNSHQVMLITNECSSNHRMTTIPWMVNSVFCVQAPGDSPTRKSFYDSILSGCIPIIFKEKYNVTYPFQDLLDYSDFTVTVHATQITEKNELLIDIANQIPSAEVAKLHENLLRVAKWFQYSLSDGDFQEDNDAVTLLLRQLKNLYHL